MLLSPPNAAITLTPQCIYLPVFATCVSVITNEVLSWSLDVVNPFMWFLGFLWCGCLHETLAAYWLFLLCSWWKPFAGCIQLEIHPLTLSSLCQVPDILQDLGVELSRLSSCLACRKPWVWSPVLRAWWCMLLRTTFARWSQEDHKFQGILSSTTSLRPAWDICFKKTCSLMNIVIDFNIVRCNTCFLCFMIPVLKFFPILLTTRDSGIYYPHGKISKSPIRSLNL